jgi:uracil-DNA glycosylase family 4
MELSTRREVEEAIAKCTACHLAGPGVAPVPFRGPTPAIAAVIGEAPGKVENVWGKPLIGPAGQLLDETLRLYGADCQSLAYFNVVSCFPLVMGDKKPTPESITACRPHFEAQLELIDPKYVLVLGNYALQAFRPGARIMSSRGIWWEDAGKRFLPTVHPAGVLRNDEWKPLFHDDIKEFVRCMSST